MDNNSTRMNQEHRLLRHATLTIKINDIVFLVDPMLSEKSALDPVPNAGNAIRIPMVELPIDKEALNQLIAGVDAVLITHLHRDHWDAAAQLLIPKDKPLFCQPGDEVTLQAQGFNQVQPVSDELVFKGVTIHRTGGQHGTGEIGQKMGKVSGFVLEAATEKIYIAGDTIWCREVENALRTFQPHTIIVNTGAPRFSTGDPITMTAADVIQVSKAMPQSTIVAVHMETVNHCTLTRAQLKEALLAANSGNVLIPLDGAYF